MPRWVTLGLLGPLSCSVWSPCTAWPRTTSPALDMVRSVRPSSAQQHNPHAVMPVVMDNSHLAAILCFHPDGRSQRV
jgi:hypothetical protein